MCGTISEQDQAWMNYIGNGGSMEPSDTFDAGWDAAQVRINQLERLNAVLSAEIDLLRPVIEACQLAKRNGLIGPNSGFTMSKIYHAVVAYEAAKERG